MRVAWGIDVHAVGGNRSLKLGGVVFEGEIGLVGTSDADVVAHAVIDAVLGLGALGDLGSFYPSDDPAWVDADSMGLLADAIARLQQADVALEFLDVTIVAQSVRIAPQRDLMRQLLAEVAGLDLGQVSVKATTTDSLGFLGRDEGIAAVAVASGRHNQGR